MYVSSTTHTDLHFTVSHLVVLKNESFSVKSYHEVVSMRSIPSLSLSLSLFLCLYRTIPLSALISDPQIVVRKTLPPIMASQTSPAPGAPAADFQCRQQIIQHIKLSLMYTAMDVKWVPQSSMMAVVGQHPNYNGSLMLYQLQHGELKTAAEARLTVPLKCCTVGHSPASAPSIATGDFIGGLRIWDARRLGELMAPPAASGSSMGRREVTPDAVCDQATIFSVPRAHDSIVNCVDGCRRDGPPELVTGSRDGAVKVWDSRQANRPVVVLEPVERSRARDCWCVRFGNSFDPDERVVAAGYDNGDVKLFDLRTRRMIEEMSTGNGVCDIEFDRPDIPINKCYVSMLEGKVRVTDLRTQHPKLGFAYVEDRVSEGTIWCSRALPQNREVFISGGGGDLTLSRYEYPPERSLRDPDGVARGVAGSIVRINQVKVGDQPVNALDWNDSKEGLLACTSLDQSVRVMLVTKLSLLK